MQAKGTKQWLYDALLKGTFLRYDYRELAQLKSFVTFGWAVSR